MKNRSFRSLVASLAVLCAVPIAGCNKAKSSIPLNPAAFLGTWSGTWTNTTFSSTGAVTIVVSEAGGVVTVNVDMDGSVFGGGDPAAEDFTATFSGTTGTLDPKTSAVYGDVTATLNSNGSVTVNGVNIAGQVASFTLTGTWGASQIDVNVAITFDDASTAAANGTLTKL